MANIFLAWQNRTDEATLSNGSWLSSLPLANLQNRQVQKVARSSDATNASTIFDIDLNSTSKGIGVLALVVHNISVAGKVRIRGATANTFAGGVTLYDSGWVDVWPSGVVDQSLLEWEDDNFWLGTLSANQRAGFQSPYICKLSSVTIARYWRVEIDDTTNTDGFVQIGRLFMARGWTPTVNFSTDGDEGYSDKTVIAESLSGAEYFDVRTKPRERSFELKALTDSEAYSYALEMQRLCGVSGEVLVMPDGGANLGQQPLRSYVGRLKTMSRIGQPKNGVYTWKVELKELL